MKKFFIVLAFWAIAWVGTAQSFKLDECTRFTQKSATFTKTAAFNDAGINLSKYDYSNATLNCHINSTMHFAKKSKGKKIGGIVAASAGGVFLLGGASLLANIGGGGGATMTAIGSLGLVGSVPLFIFSKKDKNKMNYHLDQVSEYYRTNKMF